MSDSEVAYPTADSVCSYTGCERPAWRSCPEGKCLYHSPSNGDSAETARLVWQTAREMAACKPNYQGWYFPEEPGVQPHVRRSSGNFIGIEFAQGASFVLAKFSGSAAFDGATFKGHSSFRLAKFAQWVSFRGVAFGPNADFVGVTFQSYVYFNRTSFHGYAWFLGDIFFEQAWFELAAFHFDVVFAGATFRNGAWFQGAQFGPGASLVLDRPRRRHALAGPRRRRSFLRGFNIIVRSIARDAWSMFGAVHRGDLQHVAAAIRPAKHWPAFLAGHPRPFIRPRDGTMSYRLAKQTAQATGDYNGSGRYHYAEQCAVENGWLHAWVNPVKIGGEKQTGLAFAGAFLLWIGRLLFGRLIYGYGERPMRPLFIALAVIVLWAGFYCLWDAVVPSDPGLESAARAVYEPSIGECLYCSIVTFTTLGYGDYQPKEPYRLLAASEALLGAALMAVFIVCLSKKYVR